MMVVIFNRVTDKDVSSSPSLSLFLKMQILVYAYIFGWVYQNCVCALSNVCRVPVCIHSCWHKNKHVS